MLGFVSIAAGVNDVGVDGQRYRMNAVSELDKKAANEVMIGDENWIAGEKMNDLIIGILFPD
ncbi:hypothetical protein WIT60_15840 [Aquabacterium sp. G14]|uniref:hypothetical protein n=1 Tax=Aquabacterium sp. G14 TaxID=3130164 RepID=UPI00309BA909